MTPAGRTRYRSPAGPPAALDPYHDQGRLLALQVLVCERLDEFLAALGVGGLGRSARMVYGRCPVHGGTNPSALNLYRDGEEVPGYWKCNTKRCHDTFKRTVLGFARGVLSRERYGWEYLEDPGERGGQKTASWKEAVDWCCAFLGLDIRSLEVDHAELEKRRFASGVAQLTRGGEPGPGAGGPTRAQVRKWLDIPAAYFARRGWSPEVLDRYDVGLYRAPGRPLSGRVAVPVYDEAGRVAVGFTGRSVHERCPLCRRFHAPRGCPDPGDREALALTAKWYNHGLRSESHLYNWWSARRHVRSSGVAVLVEGPGDVWRLEEAGVHCGLALFGVHLSDQQKILLETSGAMNLVVLTDADGAGRGAREELRQKLGRCFRLHFPEAGAHDVGDLRVCRVRELLLPLLGRLKGGGC